MRMERTYEVYEAKLKRYGFAQTVHKPFVELDDVKCDIGNV